MLNIRNLLLTILTLILLSGVQSFADTFVVTNLNDPGAGSLRQAITNSNLTPGPDEIVFEEGLEGTIFLNLRSLEIQDDLIITGPGADRITIDADNLSPIFEINDFDDEVNSVVKISGLRLINGDGGINNYSENVEVENCQFINNNASVTGGAILNRNILTVDLCLFENNSATFGGGAISNDAQGAKLIIRNSHFLNNHDPIGGGAIANVGTIELITNSTFANNNVIDIDSSGGAIQNLGTIKEISHSTFENNGASGTGGAINNFEGLIESIVNSTFTENIAQSGSVIWNDGVINISFTTMARNKPLPVPTPPPPPMGMEPLGVIVTVGNGVTKLRNSILPLNNVGSCVGPVIDLLGNWASDASCGFLGDNVEIIIGPLSDNGGPTETIALLGGDPLDGATLNCDALDENGNPTGIPIGVDQRYFPRPSGARCDSGAFETGPESIVTITKVTDPPGGSDFRFGSDGFNPLQQCPLDGGGDGIFALNDGDSISCRVPEGEYSINELVPTGYELFIACFGDNENLIIDNDKGEIVFTVPEIEPSPDVDCLFTNVRTVDGGDGGGCTLAPTGAKTSIPLYLLIPALILVRRFVKRYRS